MFQSSNVTIMVYDFEKMLKFYTQALGFKLRHRFESDWAEVEGPGVVIGLHPAGKDGAKPSGGNYSIGLQVEHLETAMSTLRDRGIEFAPHISEDGPVRLAFFTDSEGNALYLSETK